MPSLREMREFIKHMQGVLTALGTEHGVQKGVKLIKATPSLNADMEKYVDYVQRYGRVKRAMVRDVKRYR